MAVKCGNDWQLPSGKWQVNSGAYINQTI